VVDEPEVHDTRLRRSLNLPLMILYGLGTTVGAGIYALIGEIAGVAGMLAPWSFLGACVLAGFTALSFAELAARMPRAGAAALYVQSGFSSPRAGVVVGILMALTGVVSSAALLNAFVGYATVFVDIGRVPLIVLTLFTLAAIASWGIKQSVVAAAIVSIIEVGGLLWITALGAETFATLPDRFHEFVPDTSAFAWSGILAGGVLAFYAFIGFEDLVDLAEEVRNVERTLPRAILATLGITTIVYLLLITLAVLAIPPAELGTSSAPLADLYTHFTGREPTVIAAIGLFAIVNGVMIQIIMASRILYGLASRGRLPAIFAHVNPRTRTPLFSTAIVSVAVLMLAIIGGLASLAEATSILMLSIFAVVNLALWRIKGTTPTAPGVRVFPRSLSLAGAVVCVAFVLIHLFS
jgi:amino acid transporter